MRGANLSIVNIVLLMLLIAIILNPISSKADADACNHGLSCDNTTLDHDSNVIVMQHLTAIWCDICSSTESSIEQFTEDRGRQVARISYHPDDGLDYLGNRLTTYQLWHLGQNPTEAEFPSIWMDNDEITSGLINQNQLQKLFLKSSSQRTSHSTLQLSVSKYENRLEYNVETNSHESTHLYIIMTENGVLIDKPESYNGVKIHNNVARHGVVINMSNGEIEFSEPNEGWSLNNWENNEITTNISITFNLSENTNHELEKWGLVTYLENNNREIIAAQQIQPTENHDDEGNGYIIILSGIVLTGLILATPILNSIQQKKDLHLSNDGAECEE
ncbi:MAG: hypothetical protein CMO20_04605 [Thermoplasmata archaeon]|nr:hypothetical protein [Thermoplasmata archaeon]